MLWELFFLFFKTGAISFGGGYTVIASIQREVTEKGWITPERFQELVALAGMSPGSIATNMATLIGYSQMGVIGGIISTIGIILPSLFLVIIGTAFFFACRTIIGSVPHFTGYVQLLQGLLYMQRFTLELEGARNL